MIEGIAQTINGNCLEDKMSLEIMKRGTEDVTNILKFLV